jgi:hypothetical protein
VKKGVEFEVKLGGISGSDLRSIKNQNTDQKEILPLIAGPRRRGKAREYSEAFEAAWSAYGRHEEKLRAFGQWVIAAKSEGGETLLLPLILTSLSWQSKLWAPEGWKFAPYFERYLKRRKWEDERPAQAPLPRPIDRAVAAEQEREQRQKAARWEQTKALAAELKRSAQ